MWHKYLKKIIWSRKYVFIKALLRKLKNNTNFNKFRKQWEHFLNTRPQGSSKMYDPIFGMQQGKLKRQKKQCTQHWNSPRRNEITDLIWLSWKCIFQPESRPWEASWSTVYCCLRKRRGSWAWASCRLLKTLRRHLCLDLSLMRISRIGVIRLHFIIRSSAS